MNPQQALAFDRFLLDPVAGRLYGDATVVPLTPKASALLEYLAANAGRLLTKRELLDALWPRTYVTDGVLKVCIREIRRALDDDARVPRFIETAHRRGYRFIAPVSAVAPPGQRRLLDPLWIGGAAVTTCAPSLTECSPLANRSLMNCAVAAS
jgi:DNA-binding winged helix-turn-helix (wHTH) protein